MCIYGLPPKKKSLQREDITPPLLLLMDHVYAASKEAGKHIGTWQHICLLGLNPSSLHMHP